MLHASLDAILGYYSYATYIRNGPVTPSTSNRKGGVLFLKSGSAPNVPRLAPEWDFDHESWTLFIRWRLILNSSMAVCTVGAADGFIGASEWFIHRRLAHFSKINEKQNTSSRQQPLNNPPCCRPRDHHHADLTFTIIWVRIMQCIARLISNRQSPQHDGEEREGHLHDDGPTVLFDCERWAGRILLFPSRQSLAQYCSTFNQ